jgi:thioesterase domain-containing protein
MVNQINRCFGLNLRVVSIFMFNNVQALANTIVEMKNDIVIEFTKSSQNKHVLFMIHPGGAGCEVYIELAKKLSNSFNCYGIDYYNMYSETMIENLRDLARYYLLKIEEKMPLPKIDTIRLLGWSFGGQIALEMASILEDIGFSEIEVYLLDTIMDTPKNINTLSELRKVELQLISQGISHKLNLTKVTLAKSMLNSSTSKLTYNNIDQYVKNIDSIRLIKFENVDHMGILERFCHLMQNKEKISDFFGI